MARGVGGVLAIGLALLAFAGCKAAIGDAPRGGGGGNGGGGGVDSGDDVDGPPGQIIDAPVAIDAAVIDAPLGNFPTPAAVPIAATSKGEDDPVLTSDGLQLIFAIDNSGNNPSTGKDFYLSTRATPTGAFGTPTALTTLNTPKTEESPRLSPDDLTLYYASGGVIMSAKRTATTAPFGAGSAVSFLSGGPAEKWFHSCDTGYYLVVEALSDGSTDLYEGTVGTAPTRDVTELNSSANEISVDLSPDCLTVTFASSRVANTVHIFRATRPTATSTWSAPAVDIDFGETADDEDLYITPNGHFAVLASTRGPSGSKDVFQTER